MLRVLITIAVVAFLWWFLFIFNKAPAAQRKQLLTKFLLYALAGGLLLLVVTGRAHWLFAIVGAAIPWLQRLMVLKNAWNAFKPKSEPTASPGKQSTVRSEFLTMSLDHDSGEMNGQVLKGQFTGKELKQLDQSQLFDLLTECSADNDSRNLLQAYLDFRFGNEWREQASASQDSIHDVSNTVMTEPEALAILGLEQGASTEEITLAHKKLMQKLHPDRGGSEYLASKINQAKESLLS